jgi:hypothetical protein
MNTTSERPAESTGQPQHHTTGLDRRSPLMRVDLTINIPTLISIAVLIVTISASGVGLYYNLDKRQLATEFAIQTLSQRLDKTEAALTTLKADQVGQNTALRSEMKSDITEIKGMLNRLIFAPTTSVQQQRQLREWSKE